MIPARSFAGKKVALFGLGGSGLATARALVAGGASVLAWDDNPESVTKAEAEGIAAGDLRAAQWLEFAALVLAPGVPLTHPKPHWTAELAHAAGVEIIGDIELLARERRALATEAPLIAECVAHIECNVRDRVSIGDHDLFVATPMRVTALEEAFNGVWVTENDAGRVLHHLGGDLFSALGKSYQGKTPESEDE